MIKITKRERSTKLQLTYSIDNARKRVSTGLDDNVKNRTYLKTVLIPQLELKISRGDIYVAKDISFNFYANCFLQDKEKNTKGFMSKLSIYSKVIDTFKDKKVTDITRFEIKQYLNGLDMKNTSKRAYKSCIKEVLELAVDDNVISFNAGVGITLPPDKNQDIQYFTKNEVQSILNATGGFFKVYLTLAFNTGMRPEEILGLQLQDISKDYITIQRVRTKGRIDTPKTKNSFRKVPYPSYLYQDLINLQDTSSLFLFKDINDAGRLRHQWRKAIGISGVQYKKLYCTRHTFATLMLKENIISINELAGLLGHSSPKVTLNHYASVIDPVNVKLNKDFSLFEQSSDTLLTHSNSKISITA